MLCFERKIPMVPGGPTTFRDQAKHIGLEPDECYFLATGHTFSRIEGAWDPTIHPSPDLVVEIDISRKSIDELPLYAALGVREIWRFDGKKLHVLLLDSAGRYQPGSTSAAFPFLPMEQFETFLGRFRTEGDTTVVRAFHKWVQTLPA